jgi:hypothetical protein
MVCSSLQEGQVLLSVVKRFPHNEQIRPASQYGHRFQCSFTGLRHPGQARNIKGYSHAGQLFQPLSIGSPHFGQKFFFPDKVIKIDQK